MLLFLPVISLPAIAMPSSEVALELAHFNLKPDHSLIVITIFLAFTTVSVLLRFYVRAVMLRKWDLSDWLLLGALVSHPLPMMHTSKDRISYFVQIVYMAESGLFLAFCEMMLAHGIVKEVPKYARVRKSLHLSSRHDIGKLTSHQMLEANEACYILNQLLIKASLAVYFLRIIVVYTWQRRVIQVAIAIYEVFNIAIFMLFIFQFGVPTLENLLLGPAATHSIGGETIAVLAYLCTGLNIAVDWIFTLLPISIVVQAHIPLRAKLTVCFILLLGAAGSIATCVRIKYLPAILAQDRARIFYVIQPFAWVAFAESSAGMIAISLATLRPLFRGLLGRAREMYPISRMSRTVPSGVGSKRTTRRFDLDLDLGDDLDHEMWTATEKELESYDGKEVTTTIETIPI